VKVKGKVKGTECGSTEMAPRNVVARSADRWRVPYMGDNGSKGKVKGTGREHGDGTTERGGAKRRPVAGAPYGRQREQSEREAEGPEPVEAGEREGGRKTGETGKNARRGETGEDGETGKTGNWKS